MIVGVCITTRNRPKTLEYCLRHFAAFRASAETVIVVCDDASSKENQQINAATALKYGAAYSYSSVRLGIAKNKNAGIRLLREAEVDHYFLFDDDCMPRQILWDLPFVHLYNKHKIAHSMYLVLAEPAVVVVKKTPDYFVWANCGGYCLYFAREAMDALQEMNKRFGIYGYEHAEMTHRAKKLGFCGDESTPYISPIGAHKFIYSIDMDLGWHQEVSPLGPIDWKFQSSIEDERPLIEGYVRENGRVFSELTE